MTPFDGRFFVRKICDAVAEEGKRQSEQPMMNIKVDLNLHPLSMDMGL